MPPQQSRAAVELIQAHLAACKRRDAVIVELSGPDSGLSPLQRALACIELELSRAICDLLELRLRAHTGGM
jgi:hypothetical protein